MMLALEAARDAFAAIGGVASCKIGLEPNISPADYPLVRLVPSRITPGKPYYGRTAEVLIYFGMPTTESEGLEEVYTDLFDLERRILSVLRELEGRYLETITDRDELPTYKMMAVRCELPETKATAAASLAGSFAIEN
jgi:hypothetical protein